MHRALCSTLGSFLLLFVEACQPAGAPSPAQPERAVVTLVESVPAETTLDHADIPNAPEVWLAMIDGAHRSIDFAEFYASDVPADGPHGASLLTPIIAAIERATARGVRVRFLADALFASKYPETLARLAKAGATMRSIDVEKKTSGGVMHAKYFIVDGSDTFLGSQNFDWRALDHIYEMGARVTSPAFASAATDEFETDWQLAGGAPVTTRRRTGARAQDLDATGGERLSFVASPRGWLPDESSWDLPRLTAMIDGAKRFLHVEVLTYKTKDRAGAPFPTLDDALRRAAARGVAVRLLVSDWAQKPGSDGRAALDELARVPNVEIRVITIPRWSGGEIPFARIAHAKFMIADGAHAWVGTSNWEGDYFTKSRNVGVIVDEGRLPTSLDAAFDANWKSAYAAALPAPVKPSASGPPGYAAPPSSSGPAPP